MACCSCQYTISGSVDTYSWKRQGDQQVIDKCGGREFSNQYHAGERNKQHVEDQARQTPCFFPSTLLLKRDKHRNKCLYKCAACDKVEKRIRQSKGSIVGIGFRARAEEGIEQSLAYHTQSTRSEVSHYEQKCCFCYTKATFNEIAAWTEVRQAKAKTKWSYTP